MKKKENTIGINIRIILLVFLFIAIMFNFAYMAISYKNNIKTKNDYIRELEEKVEKYEKELTDIALNEGLLDDIKLEIQAKQNELMELDSQLSEKRQKFEEEK